MRSSAREVSETSGVMWWRWALTLARWRQTILNARCSFPDGEAFRSVPHHFVERSCDGESSHQDTVSLHKNHDIINAAMSTQVNHTVHWRNFKGLSATANTAQETQRQCGLSHQQKREAVETHQAGGILRRGSGRGGLQRGRATTIFCYFSG